jgi:hypothetical protein
MCSGSRATATGEVTLIGGGIIGTVDLDYTADVTLDDDAQFIFKWPQKYHVYVGDEPWEAIDFPTTPTGIINDDGVRNTFIYKSFELDAGAHYVVVHQIGDDGLESEDEQGGGESITTYDVPEAPGSLFYVSGGGADTIVGFAGTAEAADGYNVYDSLDTGQLNLVDIVDVHIAGTGAQTQAIDDIGSYTGLRYIVIRSLSGDIEEPNGNVLVLEYDAGVYVPLRPSPPIAGIHHVTAGRVLTVPWSLYLDPRLQTPTTIQLFVYLVGDAPDYENPTAEESVPSNPGETHSLTGEIEATLGADGIYLYELRTLAGGEEPLLNELDQPVLNESDDPVMVTTGDTVQSNNAQIYGPVELTILAMAEPEFFVINGG